MSEPAALDLAAARKAIANIVETLQYFEYRTEGIEVGLETLVDELERCRAERDALRAAIDEIDHYTYGWTFERVAKVIDDIRLKARAALGEMTQCTKTPNLK